jgi:effector-binding domain-containing protein
MDEISIVEVRPQKVVGIRKQGKYELIPKLLQMVYEFASSNGAEFSGPPMFVCHEIRVEDVMKADEEGTADIEIAFPITKEINGTDEIKCYDLPGGKMAKIIHKGPYEKCTPTYERLYLWIDKNKKIISGPIREVYLNDPSKVSEDEILTEIYAPIK